MNQIFFNKIKYVLLLTVFFLVMTLVFAGWISAEWSDESRSSSSVTGSNGLDGDISAEKPVSVNNVGGGQSVVYYLKMLNSKLFDIDSKTEVVFDPVLKQETIKASEVVSKSQDSVQNVNSQNTVTWSNVRSNKASIVFPIVRSKVRSSEGQLSLMYAKGKVLGSFDWGERYFSVLNKNVVQTCYDRTLSLTKFNNFVLGSDTSLYFFSGESEEICNASLIDNLPIVSIVIDKKEGYDNISITSPLIPDVCNGKTFDNVLSDEESVLSITKEMCEKA